MTGTTVTVGVLLIVLGVVGYVATGAASITALIPAFFGLLIALLGFVARHEAYRRHAMHGAVLLGLLGFLGSVRGLTQLPALLGGEAVARPAAVISQSLMAAITFVFVILCVRSFIAARAARRG